MDRRDFLKNTVAASAFLACNGAEGSEFWTTFGIPSLKKQEPDTRTVYQVCLTEKWRVDSPWERRHRTLEFPSLEDGYQAAAEILQQRDPKFEIELVQFRYCLAVPICSADTEEHNSDWDNNVWWSDYSDSCPDYWEDDYDRSDVGVLRLEKSGKDVVAYFDTQCETKEKAIEQAKTAKNEFERGERSILLRDYGVDSYRGNFLVWKEDGREVKLFLEK